MVEKIRHKKKSSKSARMIKSTAHRSTCSKSASHKSPKLKSKNNSKLEQSNAKKSIFTISVQNSNLENEKNIREPNSLEHLKLESATTLIQKSNLISLTKLKINQKNESFINIENCEKEKKNLKKLDILNNLEPIKTKFHSKMFQKPNVQVISPPNAMYTNVAKIKYKIGPSRNNMITSDDVQKLTNNRSATQPSKLTIFDNTSSKNIATFNNAKSPDIGKRTKFPENILSDEYIFDRNEISNMLGLLRPENSNTSSSNNSNNNSNTKNKTLSISDTTNALDNCEKKIKETTDTSRSKRKLKKSPSGVQLTQPSFHVPSPREAFNNSRAETDSDSREDKSLIPEVLRKQGMASFCSAIENNCPCNTLETIDQFSKEINISNRETWITDERMKELKLKAQDALKNHKIFSIRGCYFSVRTSLAKRGWVEKLYVHRKHGMYQVNDDALKSLPKRRLGESRRSYLIKCERSVMSRFLEHTPIDLLWTARKDKWDYIEQAKNPAMLINKMYRVPFTTKEGLCNQLKDFHWHYENDIAEVLFPRCYNASGSAEELLDFVDNFRISSCIAFLRFLADKFNEEGNNEELFSQRGTISFSAIEFALKRCNEYVDSCKHIDIDGEEPVPTVWEHEWDNFLTYHYMLTQDKAQIWAEAEDDPKNAVNSIKKTLDSIQEFWPQYSIDGYLNLWIIKPANKCRGRGIHLLDNIKKIISFVNPSGTSRGRYVVQKYIERPLIIHNTKFDIRQWFLITSAQPLVVWMYKESYLRFSSQEYNLKSHHESVHITNHAIQRKYKNAKRDKRLPSNNMWDCVSFQAYLRQIGQYEMWSERIYPGMRKAIVGTMLASQDNIERISNTFELFGADFMISDDFHPWLIEINTNPDLGATTSVTARMCPAALQDAVKVVVDKRNDPNADTGNFELIYRQTVPPTPAYMGLNLFLLGKTCPIRKFPSQSQMLKDQERALRERVAKIEEQNLERKSSRGVLRKTSLPHLAVNCTKPTADPQNLLVIPTVKVSPSTTLLTPQSSNHRISAGTSKTPNQFTNKRISLPINIPQRKNKFSIEISTDGTTQTTKSIIKSNNEKENPNLIEQSKRVLDTEKLLSKPFPKSTIDFLQDEENDQPEPFLIPDNPEEIFELLAKPKSDKSKPNLSYRKFNCLKNLTSNEKLNGLSLRHLRSSRKNLLKNAKAVENCELNCKSAPIERKENTELTSAVRKQLCKNLSNKFSENSLSDRLNTRC